MSNIAKLSVSLEADISKFQKGMEQSSAILSSLKVNMGTLAGKGIDAFVAATSAAVVGLAYLVDKSIESITQNTRLADRLQISTEAMGGFQLAARQVGVDSEASAKSLTHLSKIIGEAQAGSEEAQEKFAKLGINLVEFSKLSASQQIGVIADVIKDAGSASTQTAIAVSFLGKAGGEMVGALSGGADALEQTTEDAKALGLALNRIDSAKVVEAHDSFEKVKEVFEGLVNKLTVELSPYIAYVANQFADWSKSSTGGIGTIGKAISWLEDIIGDIVNTVHFVEAAFYGFKAIALTVVEVIIEQFNSMFLLVEKAYNKLASLAHLPQLSLASDIKEFTDGLAIEAKIAGDAAAESFDKFSRGEGITSVKRTFEQIRIDAQQAAISIAKGVDDKQAAGRKQAEQDAKDNGDTKAKKEYEKWVETMQKKADALSKSVSPFAKFSQEITEAAELFQNKFIDSDMYTQAQKKYEKEFLDAMNKDKPKSSFKEINTAFISIEGLKKQDKQIQEVRSPQLDIIHKALEKINSTLGVKNEGVLL